MGQDLNSSHPPPEPIPNPYVSATTVDQMGEMSLEALSNVLSLASPLILTILIFGAKADMSYCILQFPLLMKREMTE